MKNLVKFGNAKLPKTTMIFNMGSSKNCPSRLLGLCECASICYARQPEKMYPNVLPCREKQACFWSAVTTRDFCKGMTDIIKRKRTKPTLFRFNESGDFYSQKCIEKLSKIAEYLLQEHGVITYGYTARKDLDFSNASFLVKGSSNKAGNHGETIVLEKGDKLPESFVYCPGSCKTCTMCSNEKPFNIAFKKH